MGNIFIQHSSVDFNKDINLYQCSHAPCCNDEWNAATLTDGLFELFIFQTLLM